MNKSVLFGSVLALGIVAFSADSASAQYIRPFGGVGAYSYYAGHGGVYSPIANRYMMQARMHSRPYYGNTYGYSRYVNPYVANFANRYSYMRNYYPYYSMGYRSNMLYPGFGYRNYGYGGYRYGGFHNGFAYGRYFR